VLVRKPLCKHCGKPNKTTRQIYCSSKCYTDSGHRKVMGAKNGAKAYSKYWQAYAEAFKMKCGHLPHAYQVRMLIKIGERRAYRRNFRESKINREAGKISQQQSE